ncbi:metal ABC transporter ATP-binding protein [Isoptericola croceus]|uniref:metal ABC transporter ATP-binding protein n=1 Tax=Isoptericola croceus TaxID=3031406 RepID=UPI0023F78363|nr:metal ABC transporter ATP-binding protein [Isoptericola croceus]
MTEAACRVSGLSVVYRTDAVLVDVDLTVPVGAVMGVVGPNGAGKSTLVKAMLGLVRPLTGTVEFFGRSLGEVRARVGYVPQSSAIEADFPITVHDAVLTGTYGELGWWGRPRRAEHHRADQALDRVGLVELGRRPIGELSGGQRQRVLLARALVQDPALFVLDEPFQGVDAHSQRAIADVLEELRSDGRTVLAVHHDLATVQEHCDHVTLLNRHVIASGPRAEVFTRDAVRTTYGAATSDEFGGLPA